MSANLHKCPRTSSKQPTEVHHDCGATRAEAEQREAQIKRDLWLQKLGRAPEHTLDEALVRWLKEELPRQRSQVSVKSHARAIAPYLRGRTIAEAPAVSAEFKAQNTHRRAATINRSLALLRRICNLAYKQWEWIDQPIGERITLLREQNERHTYLTPDQVLALAIAADKPHTEDAILIAAYTGLRLGEIVALTPANIVDGTLRIGPRTKSGRPRTVPIHPALTDALMRLPLGVKKSAIQHAFARARLAVGMPDLHFHDLRHTFASWIVQARESLYTAGALLGHASPKTTQRYSHLADENLRAAVLKIGG